MSLHIPGKSHTEAYADGVADTVATVVPSIKANDTLLAVIVVSPLADVAGLNVADFTVAAGTITAGTIDATGKRLLVLHTDESA